MPSISIIIATSSRPEALQETLRSLVDTRIPATWLVELLLIENVTQSGAEKLLHALHVSRFFAVRYFFEPARGKSRALNLALAHAIGEIMLFTDDDVRLPPDWIERMCEPITSGRTDAVAGEVSLAAHLRRPWMNHTHRAILASTADYLSPGNPSEMCGANMAVHRRVFNQIGGFDPELGPGITNGGEETLLSWRLKQAGFTLTGALGVIVEHHPSPARLQYVNWINAARLRGYTRAYLMHHWHHQSVPFPAMMCLYTRLKLFIRRLCFKRKTPCEEGIAPWELSYIEYDAMCTQYIKERRRPNKYPAPRMENAITPSRDGSGHSRSATNSH